MKYLSKILCFLILTMALINSSSKCNENSQKDNMKLNKINFVKEGLKQNDLFDASIGPYKITIMNPFSIGHRIAWEGPIIIENLNTGSSCEVDISLITDVYISDGNEMLIIISYSGSNKYIDFVNTRNCDFKYKRIIAFSEKIELSNNLIIIKPACENIDDREKYFCSSAKIISIDRKDGPVILESDSVTLTKEIIGVGFYGESLIANPKTPNARLIEDK